MASVSDVAMAFEDVFTLGSDTEKLHKKIEDMIKSLDDLISSVEGAWEGKAHQKFVSSYKDNKPQMKKISEILLQYSKNITAAATRMSGAEDSNAASF